MPGWGGGSCYSWSLQPESEGAESGETADAVTVWERAGDVDSLKCRAKLGTHSEGLGPNVRRACSPSTSTS